MRIAALGALTRGDDPAAARAGWRCALDDPDPAVRRRAAALAPATGTTSVRGLVGALGDPDPLVREAAAFACGEIRWRRARRRPVVDALVRATDDADPLVREAAVAALGAVGDEAGLAAILRACTDRPAVRRRAVLALAPFTGPDVDAALAAAATDRDWQTRQAAEDLL